MLIFLLLIFFLILFVLYIINRRVESFTPRVYRMEHYTNVNIDDDYEFDLKRILEMRDFTIFSGNDIVFCEKPSCNISIPVGKEINGKYSTESFVMKNTIYTISIKVVIETTTYSNDINNIVQFMLQKDNKIKIYISSEEPSFKENYNLSICNSYDVCRPSVWSDNIALPDVSCKLVDCSVLKIIRDIP